MNKPLLSICIPTYNGAEKLQSALLAISESLLNYQAFCKDEYSIYDVDVIISDNASSDNTGIIVKQFSDEISNIKYFRNQENLGFNRNLILLTDVYSDGEYTWIIGDDDYIDRDSIRNIITIIRQNPLVNLFILNYRQFNNLDDFDCFRRNAVDTIKEYKMISMFQAIESNCSFGNILCTFMSISIFRSESVRMIEKNSIMDNDWDKYYKVFPNAFLMINAFKTELVCCIYNPLLSTIVSAKNWDDKLPKLFYKILPELYFSIIDNRKDNNLLEKNREYIILGNVSFLIKGRNNLKIMIKHAMAICRLISFRTTLNIVGSRYLVYKNKGKS